MSEYKHKKIEKKWQKIWEESNVAKINKDDTSKEKCYVLDMFPYPSGDGLHMGHTESYTASDIYARYKRMQGFNVLHPQGFDSFGLPAENYAIKTGTHPKETTAKNIQNYIRQMKSLGLNYDFDEKIVTSSPEYYKWTQWIFGKFFENGLAYKKTAKTNWCPSCNTIIANEQVEDGKCERCKTEIEQKEVPGWFFKITDFADELIEGLDKVDWPEYTKTNQKNWIGKSEGAEIEFEVVGANEKIKVFTTRPDTLFGASYMVLAPEHNLVERWLSDGLIKNTKEVEDYIAKTKNKTELERMEGKEKTGVELKGIKAVNPANNEEIPIFVADYVLANYGTGAIMAVPAHDERDFEFARKFGLPVWQVVSKENTQIKSYLMGAQNISDDDLKKLDIKIVETLDGGDRKIIIPKRSLGEYEKLISEKLTNGFWNEYVGKETIFIFKHKNGKVERIVLSKDTEEKIDKLAADFMEETDWEKSSVYKWLAENDWYTDIIIHSEKGVLINSGKFDGMDSEEVKKAITEFVGGRMTATYRLRDWSISRQRYWGAPIPIVYSPDGEARFVGEKNLPWSLPEDVDFVPTGTAPLAKSRELKERVERIFGKCWTPETDTMDTFVCSSWYYLRYPDPHNDKEFCSKERLKHWLPVDLYIGGAEHTYMHLLYARFFTKALKKIGVLSFDEPFLKLRHQGMVLDEKGVKMSKSKGNVVNPDEMVERYGADAVRMYMMFAGPLDEDVLWREDNIVGVYRFLERVWKLKEKISKNADEKNIEIIFNKTIKKVGEDVENMKFNTAISQMMKLVNEMEKYEVSSVQYQVLLQLLAPFAPHITEELWEELGNKSSIHFERWPEYDENKMQDKSVTIAVQVNGKVRATFEIEAEVDEESVKKTALELETVQKWIDGKEVKKVIYVPNKLISIVID